MIPQQESARFAVRVEQAMLQPNLGSPCMNTRFVSVALAVH